MSDLASGLRDAFGAVQDVDEQRHEVLVDIPWEVLDTYRSDFARGCFDDYLRQRLPVMCYQHLKTEPIGRVRDWQKGARANQFVARFSDFDAVPRARQAFAQLRDGDLTDFSFYYDEATAIPHPNTRGAVRFTKARMPEISPVTVGSIPGAMATGVRMEFPDELYFGYYPGEVDAARSRYERAVDLELEVQDALGRLERINGRGHATSEAGIRARVATLASRPLPMTVERERQIRRLMDLDREPPQRILEDPAPYKPPPRDPASPPAEDLALIGQNAKERGESAIAAVQAAEDGWRATYGAMYAGVRAQDNAPVMTSVGIERPYPPDEVLEVAALSASDRGISARQAVDEAIRNWRTTRGFE